MLSSLPYSPGKALPVEYFVTFVGPADCQCARFACSLMDSSRQIACLRQLRPEPSWRYTVPILAGPPVTVIPSALPSSVYPWGHVEIANLP